MDNQKFSDSTCSVARALDLVGDAWSMLILRDAGYGLTRYDQFRTSLGIAPNILARRLKTLTAAGLLEKSRYSEHPPREEYLITQAGRDFLPILAALGAWGRKYNARGSELGYLRDVEAGHPVEAVVIDAVTGAPIGSRPLKLIVPT